MGCLLRRHPYTALAPTQGCGYTNVVKILSAAVQPKTQDVCIRTAQHTRSIVYKNAKPLALQQPRVLKSRRWCTPPAVAEYTWVVGDQPTNSHSMDIGNCLLTQLRAQSNATHMRIQRHNVWCVGRDQHTQASGDVAAYDMYSASMSEKMHATQHTTSRKKHTTKQNVTKNTTPCSQGMLQKRAIKRAWPHTQHSVREHTVYKKLQHCFGCSRLLQQP